MNVVTTAPRGSQQDSVQKVLPTSFMHVHKRGLGRDVYCNYYFVHLRCPKLMVNMMIMVVEGLHNSYIVHVGGGRDSNSRESGG